MPWGHEQGNDYSPMPWNTNHLILAVQEPFDSQASQPTLLYGEIDESEVLTLRSRMPYNGMIFSDGMESDFLRFTAGMEARIGVCATKGIQVQ